jgi:hypothetical protein
MPYRSYKVTVANYNWYFNSPISPSGWSDYNKSQNGWGPGAVDVDIPRFFQIYRKGLINSQAIWSTMAGFGYYYYGLGGEFGSSNEPLPNGIPFKATPWSTTGSTSDVNVDEMVAPHGTVGESYGRVIAKTNKSWYANYSIGELFPDSEYLTNWSIQGNLPTGSGKYYRASYADAALTNNWHNRERQVLLEGMGCSSFFNSVNSINKGPFKHAIRLLQTASISILGMDLSGLFNFTFPSELNNRNPWRLDETTNYPPEWNDTVYSSQRVLAEIPTIGGIKRVFYDSDWNHPFHASSGTVRLSDATGANTYFLVSGLIPQTGYDEECVAKSALTALVRSFFDGGLYSAVENKITQLPQLQISQPSSSTEILPATQDLDVGWQINWKKWDGFKYTFEYPDDYEDTAAENDLMYHMKYSADNGATWKFCNTNIATKAGERDSDPAHIINHQPAAWTENWSIPTADFPEGIYWLRVEGFRKSIQSHYFYDQQKIFIQR